MTLPVLTAAIAHRKMRDDRAGGPIGPSCVLR
jgi:hypothetical protein